MDHAFEQNPRESYVLMTAIWQHSILDGDSAHHDPLEKATATSRVVKISKPRQIIRQADAHPADVGLSHDPS